MYRICIALTLLLSALPASGNNPASLEIFHEQYRLCLYIQDDISRLRCYDALEELRADTVTEEPELLEESILLPVDVADPSRQRRLDELDALVTRKRRGMLQSDDPNYFVYTTPINDNIGDEHHAEFYLSIKYPLAERKFNEWQDVFESRDSGWGRFMNAVTPDRFYFHYNGLYDFYAIESNRYESSPVISRQQNPGISVEYDFAHDKDTLRLGWFHESNGQQLGSDESDRLEEWREEFGDDYAFANVSRGWDYAQLRWESTSQLFAETLADRWLTYNVQLRAFCNCQAFGFDSGKEDDIWWEEGNDLEIFDFDGLRGMVEGSLWKSDGGSVALDARLDLKTGLRHSFGQYISTKFTLGAKLENVRMTLFYFDGYGRDLSTYHLRTRYAGFGLELR